MEMIQRIAVAVSLTFASAAFAQTYIVPERDCGAAALHVTRGPDFRSAGETVDADRVAEAYVSLPQKREALKPAAGSGSLDLDVIVPEEGVLMAGVGLRPEVSGQETRTEHAKVLLFCGAKAPAFDWQRTVGLGLEIYPQGWNGPRPRLKAGDSLRFIVVDKATNKLLRDLPMQLYRLDGGHVADGVPAQGGGMNFLYPEPGRYVVTATYRRPDRQQPQLWLVDTSTLTFDIR